MGEADAMENFRVHERVGTLEQKVHTLEHRAESMEWIKPEVTKHGTLISEIVANQKALEKSVQRLGDDFEELNEKIDTVIGIHQEYRTGQMQAFNDFRSDQTNAFHEMKVAHSEDIKALASKQDRLGTQLGTLAKVIGGAALLLGALVSVGKLMEMFGAKGYPETMQGQYVPGDNHRGQWVLPQAPGESQWLGESDQGN